MRASRTPATGQTRPVFRAGLGVSIHHCVSLPVCSQQAGPLSGRGLQAEFFSARMRAQSQGRRLL